MKYAPGGAPGPPAAPPASPDPAQRNVETVARLEQTAQAPRSLADRFIDTITSFVGSLPFIYLHLIGFAFWIALNAGARQPVDPFPFPLLALFLGMEAILLATLILIGQNRQQRLSDRRAHLDLQINMLAEQEATKILEMLEAIQRHLGIGGHDPEVMALKQATEPEQLMVQIEQHVERLEQEPNPE
jgi:uncharacterized membrane protein